MNDLGPLFDPAPRPSTSEPPDRRTWGVLELNEAIQAALQASFPGEIWLRGEIQGLRRTRMRRHWYFELVEKDPVGDDVRARVSVALLQWNRVRVERDMRMAPGFELDDDVEVRIRCRVGYYAPWGKLQLEMVGVDPAFTLGQMAANRERILRALRNEGLLERNSQLDLPAVPLRVGLITSVGSAAYNDFIREIERGGHGFQIKAVDARVQGAEMEATVLAALRTLAHQTCDVVVLIRGGGSRSDLAGFDSEAIARAIADMPVPVLTGIGHEIDVSVADHVAHRFFKTPTAVGAFLVERVEGFRERMERLWLDIAGHVLRELGEEDRRLRRLARDVHRGARATAQQRARDLLHHGRHLRRAAAAAVHRRESRLQRHSGQIIAQVLLRLGERRAQLVALRRAFGRGPLLARLRRHEEELRRSGRRLVLGGRRGAVRGTERLDGVASRVRALDPRRLLARGYSLSYDAQGRLLRTVQDVREGQLLQTLLPDGELRSEIRERRLHPEGDRVEIAQENSPQQRGKERDG